MVDDRCFCGQESTVGMHGVTSGKVESFYLCDAHYNARKRG